MRGITRIAALLLVALAGGGGCAVAQPDRSIATWPLLNVVHPGDDSSVVHPGMEMAQVRAILGPADLVVEPRATLAGTLVQWRYTQRGAWRTGLSLRFYDGRYECADRHPDPGLDGGADRLW